MLKVSFVLYGQYNALHGEIIAVVPLRVLTVRTSRTAFGLERFLHLTPHIPV
jgi:hypothetical protein